MENKDQTFINNTNGNINPSSAALTSAVTFDTATHQASSEDIFHDVSFDDDESFDLWDMYSDEDFDFGTTSSIFDVLGEPSSPVMLPDQAELFSPTPALALQPEVNVNSTADDLSMISQSSNVTATQGQVTEQIGRDGENQEKVNGKKKLLKLNNTSTSIKPRLPRYAFVTKSKIDVIDDGYKWRKYGQKIVKNSSFPRNYYRCIVEGCGVVKMAERSSQDPSTVVTTYVGNHNHICPANAPRGSMRMSSKSHAFPGSSSGVGRGNFSGRTNFGDYGASFSSGIGRGNFGNRISGGSFGDRFSCAIAGNMKGASGSIGGASGGNVGSLGSTYGLGGSHFITSGIAGASCGGRFSSAIGSISEGEILEIGNNNSGSRMLIDNGYNAAAIQSSIGSHAINGGDSNGFGGSAIGAGASDHMSLFNYTTEQVASYQQHWNNQNQQYLHNSPALFSPTFGAPDVVSAAGAASTQVGAAAAAAATQAVAAATQVVAAASTPAAAPTTTTFSSAAMDSGILSFENSCFYPLEMYEELRGQELLQDMLPPQMRHPKKSGGI